MTHPITVSERSLWARTAAPAAATLTAATLTAATLLVAGAGVGPSQAASPVRVTAPGAATPRASAARTGAPRAGASVAATVGTRIGSLALPVPAGAVVVSPTGSDNAAGTAAAPLRTVARAVRVAPAHGTIVLRAGTYHESVELPYGKALNIQNWPGETVWFDGTRVVTGFVPDGGVWRVGWTVRYDDTDPSGLMVGPANPAAAHPAEAFVDGVPLAQVLSRAAVRPGTFYVDAAADLLWLGSAPAGHEVRVSDLVDALYINGGTGSSVRGIGFQRYATPLARMGMVKGYADDVTIADCAFRYSATAGLSLNGRHAQVLRNTFTDNGQLGVQGNHTDDLLMVGNDVRVNNRERFATDQAAGGIKLTQAQRLTLRGNLVGWNYGDGIWLDESVKGADVVGNTLVANSGYGMQFEISAALVAAGNTVTANGRAGIRILESNDVRIWNNLVTDNPRDIDLLDGPRISTSFAVRGHDSRFGYDPAITWEIDDIDVQNNVIGLAATAAIWGFGYDDARHRYSGYLRHIVLDHNGWYSAAPASTWLVTWGDYPTGMRTARTFAAVRGLVRGEAHGVFRALADDPWSAAVAPLGAPLPADVAAALGVPSGALLGIGVPPGSATRTVATRG